MKEIDLHPMIRTICGISFEEMIERFDAYYPMEYRRINKLKTEVRKLRAEVRGPVPQKKREDPHLRKIHGSKLFRIFKR